jgi:hypothetical protein
MLYPTWAELKAHPILAIGGGFVGFMSASTFGGIGRMAGSKNILLSEALGLAGNVLGTEIPARVVSMFNFRGKDVMAKGIRATGYLVTVVSLVMGIVRIAMNIKKNGGVKGLAEIKVDNPFSLGATLFTIPTDATDVKNRIKAVTGTGLLGMENPIADIVSSGVQQGYTEYQPMGVSEDYDQFMSDVYMDGVSGVKDWLPKNLPFWKNAKAGDEKLVSQIQNLADELGLSEADLMKISSEYHAGTSVKEGELPGLGQSTVPSAYSGGMQEFVQ